MQVKEPAFLEDIVTHLKCWEARVKKHDFRVSMAGEDSETSRHRADELRQCIKEIKKLFGIKEPEPPKPATAKAESSSVPATVSSATTQQPKAVPVTPAAKAP